MIGKTRIIGPITLVIMGLTLLGVYLFQPITLIINGTRTSIRTSALSAAGILRSAGHLLYAGDKVDPNPSTWILTEDPIIVSSSSSIILWLDDQRIPITTTTRYPLNLLQEYGIRPFPLDELIVDGKSGDPEVPFNSARTHTIQVHRNSTATTVSNGPTIGETLARQGRPLMGLDRTLLEESWKYSGGEIQVQRIQDTLQVKTSSIPFEYQSLQDPSVDLDTQVITQAGEYGLSIDLTRIRNTDGVAGAPTPLNSQVIRQPVDQILSYGTNAVVKQAVVDGVTLNYWRAVSMYATSYSPCRSGVADCLYGTASGMPVAKGVAAVVSRWFPYMNGQRIYVPGYGFATIADTGGGIPGQYWIDLGFSDADYESWHQWVTVYFLEPVPPNILYVLN